MQHDSNPSDEAVLANLSALGHVGTALEVLERCRGALTAGPTERDTFSALQGLYRAQHEIRRGIGSYADISDLHRLGVPRLLGEFGGLAVWSVVPRGGAEGETVLMLEHGANRVLLDRASHARALAALLVQCADQAGADW